MPELKCILLVEDDPYDVELILAGLDSNNLANKVVVARDGEEALDFFNCCGKFTKRTGVDPAVVMLDLKLPKISGLEVLRRIKTDEKLKFVPVVILTSSKEDKDIIEGYKLGANAYVVKPVEFHAFIDAVKQTGAFWAIVNEPPPVSEC
ncbi:MAG TPA: two-component system response regulator [Nitrospiraceae bacterium]|jgi:DNA-binding response OmpR family regulator|nr:two-component system response regulator [Nitrospiraceae bacterium]